MIIDSHTHLIEPESQFSETMDGSVETLLRAMDGAGIDRAVTFVIEPFDRNTFVADACRRFPDRLIGFASVDPNAVVDEDPVRALDQILDLYPFRGVKLHPRHQGFSMSDDRHLRLFGAIAERQLPVLIDCISQPSKVPLADNLPFEADRLMRQVPDLTLIMAHMGGHRVLDAYAVALQHPGVFLDLAWVLHLYRGSTVEQDVRFAVKQLAPKRQVIWGSDHPSLNNLPIEVSKTEWMNIFEEIDLARDDVDAAMGGTISTILNLDEECPPQLEVPQAT
jgi:predicted TIM-barrel fold metal-dependent hydrolase